LKSPSPKPQSRKKFLTNLPPPFFPPPPAKTPGPRGKIKTPFPGKKINPSPRAPPPRKSPPEKGKFGKKRIWGGLFFGKWARPLWGDFPVCFFSEKKGIVWGKAPGFSGPIPKKNRVFFGPGRGARGGPLSKNSHPLRKRWGPRKKAPPPLASKKPPPPPPFPPPFSQEGPAKGRGAAWGPRGPGGALGFFRKNTKTKHRPSPKNRPGGVGGPKIGPGKKAGAPRGLKAPGAPPPLFGGGGALGLDFPWSPPKVFFFFPALPPPPSPQAPRFGATPPPGQAWAIGQMPKVFFPKKSRGGGLLPPPPVGRARGGPPQKWGGPPPPWGPPKGGPSAPPAPFPHPPSPRGPPAPGPPPWGGVGEKKGEFFFRGGLFSCGPRFRGPQKKKKWFGFWGGWGGWGEKKRFNRPRPPKAPLLKKKKKKKKFNFGPWVTPKQKGKKKNSSPLAPRHKPALRGGGPPPGRGHPGNFQKPRPPRPPPPSFFFFFAPGPPPPFLERPTSPFPDPRPQAPQPPPRPAAPKKIFPAPPPPRGPFAPPGKSNTLTNPEKKQNFSPPFFLNSPGGFFWGPRGGGRRSVVA